MYIMYAPNRNGVLFLNHCGCCPLKESCVSNLLCNILCKFSDVIS